MSAHAGLNDQECWSYRQPPAEIQPTCSFTPDPHHSASFISPPTPAKNSSEVDDTCDSPDDCQVDEDDTVEGDDLEEDEEETWKQSLLTVSRAESFVNPDCLMILNTLFLFLVYSIQGHVLEGA